jgi:hypothetical protein
MAAVLEAPAGPPRRARPAPVSDARATAQQASMEARGLHRPVPRVRRAHHGPSRRAWTREGRTGPAPCVPCVLHGPSRRAWRREGFRAQFPVSDVRTLPVRRAHRLHNPSRVSAGEPGRARAQRAELHLSDARDPWPSRRASTWEPFTGALKRLYPTRRLGVDDLEFCEIR